MCAERERDAELEIGGLNGTRLGCVTGKLASCSHSESNLPAYRAVFARNIH
jgi:hypothetical protein